MPAYALPDLAYDYSALEPLLSGEMLELHHGGHHAAYVKGANETLERIEEAQSNHDLAALCGLQKTLAFHVSGHFLHSLLWRNLAPGGGEGPERHLGEAIGAGFGGLAALKAQMNAAALSIQGSGWAVLSWEPLAGRLLVQQIHDHQRDASTAAMPLLAIDMWEHAFYLQYRNDKGAWLDAFWRLVNWTDVESGFAAVRR